MPPNLDPNKGPFSNPIVLKVLLWVECIFGAIFIYGMTSSEKDGAYWFALASVAYSVVVMHVLRKYPVERPSWARFVAPTGLLDHFRDDILNASPVRHRVEVTSMLRVGCTVFGGMVGLVVLAPKFNLALFDAVAVGCGIGFVVGYLVTKLFHRE